MIDSLESSSDWPVYQTPRLLRLALQLTLCATLLPCLTQCSSKKGYQAANYSPAKLATPEHNLSQREYPFDASGKYRKDWVKNGSRTLSGNNVNRPRFSSSSSSSDSRTASATPQPSTSTSRSSVPTRVASSSSSSPPRQQTQSAPAPKPKPKPKPKPAARYHTVLAKQTLWAISQKYGISVDALKRANGLRSDLIRPGQSLRIP